MPDTIISFTTIEYPNQEPSGCISAVNVACAITSWPNSFPPPDMLVSIAGNPNLPESIGLLVSLKAIEPVFFPSIFFSIFAVYQVAIKSEIKTTLILRLLLPLLRLLQYNGNIMVTIGVTLRNSSHQR